VLAVARLLPGLWLGGCCCVALVWPHRRRLPAGAADAGRVVGRMLAQEAYTSLALGVVLLLLERRAAPAGGRAGQGSQFSAGMVLALGAVFCTVAGYFGCSR
jgi:hypothetical protein